MLDSSKLSCNQFVPALLLSRARIINRQHNIPWDFDPGVFVLQIILLFVHYKINTGLVPL